MKSNIILSGMAAVLVSVAGANALEYRPFVGATMGFQGGAYSDSAKDVERIAHIDFPTDFFMFGVETGVRAGGYNQIYNGGITLSATKTTYSKIHNKYSEKTVANMDLLNLSVSYDNYIRISGDKSSRIDLVLGAGFGTMAAHIDARGDGSDTYWSVAPEVKAGMDFELTQNVTLSATGRVIIPTRSDYDFAVSYIIGGTVKYVF